MSKLLLQCVFLVVSVHYGSSKPNGAPTAACGTMIPGHSGSGENSQSPFTTKPTNVEILSNGVLELTLDGGSEKFKGFLVMAFDNSTDSISKPLGTFTAGKSYQAIDCSSGTKNAATHTSSALKDSVVLTWSPPEDYEGFVVFKTTYVKDFSTFWVKQLSAAVRVKRAPAAAVSTTTTTTASPASTTVGTTTMKSVTSTSSSPDQGFSTTPAPAHVADSASPISVLAFYTVLIVGFTIALMA